MTTSINTWSVGAGAYSNATTESTGTSLGQEDFLQLLIAQLKNQDPLNPMEGTDFTAQLAQFSSLEQLFGIGDSLEEMLAIQSNNGTGDVGYLLGKVIVAEDDSLTVNGGLSSSANFTIEEDAAVSISIFDSYGIEVKTINAGSLEAGTYSVGWDGRDDSGVSVEDGTYSYEVSAKDSSGLPVSTYTVVSGEVTGITYEYGAPYLLLGDQMVSAGSILEVHMPETATDTES
ncbi:flagellar basal-body rod modification protein FlgD [Desulfatibacillum alkenivorans DSM 16219]|jgi:flagellar basal-body rod modification protein FlgD|uniref:Basal-body rod modification protein FlgD n=1 Tax=Desulfatibacillum alkenivorans DSM 16219 TaxID=1121393 RepID=A0A1M6HHF8_9BACT|nr:flagellar hook assembly protein FlgD [Desulfatibacillum alkenivorans]SHJ21660.1 flagellar basal-body rod modification protein FlgD [Desulfatibacillum alkenivorans DSM 16219]